MASHNHLSNGHDAPDHTPIVSFLGPVSSYTHQVLTLVDFERPPWSIGLTDFDLAQAALQRFESEKYDYRPEITITGNTGQSHTSSLSDLDQMSLQLFRVENLNLALYLSRTPLTGL